MNKSKKYELVYSIIKSVIADEDNLIANLANTCAILKEHFDHHWIGYYLVDEKNNSLVLGPFQGPLACTRIPYGKGVCGSSWKSGKALIVADVHEFEGHIACSAETNSEIVVPLEKNGAILGVLDIDSVRKNDFDAMDQEFYCKINKIILDT